MINFSSVGTWILRLLAALILLQSLFFKFSAAPESIYIFSKLGMEPWGRIGTGVLELIASTLILIPATTAIGATLTIPVMVGAVYFHLTKLGISVQNDGGQLFAYNLLVLVSSTALVIIYRSDVTRITKFLTKS